jgi:hypothetical protein
MGSRMELCAHVLSPLSRHLGSRPLLRAYAHTHCYGDTLMLWAYAFNSIHQCYRHTLMVAHGSSWLPAARPGARRMTAPRMRYTLNARFHVLSRPFTASSDLAKAQGCLGADAPLWA